MKKKTENQQPFEKMCIDCGTIFIGYGYARCHACKRKRATGRAAERRLSVRKLLLEKNNELFLKGLRVCSKCYHVRQLSEFRTSQPHRQGKINSLCDKCLTEIYESPARKENGFCANYWRKKAYTVNTVGRARIAKLLHKKTSAISLSDLDWECKPQDLAELFDRQNGKCKYCGVELTKDLVQIDHMTPLSVGGVNHIENLAICCKDCNCLKGTRTADEFMIFARVYAKRFLVAEGEDKEPDRQQS